MVEVLVNHQYQAYFCEENIWQLTQKMSGSVLMVSNRAKSVAIWHQRLAEETIQVPNYNEEKPYSLAGAVFWDYHVIFVGPPNVSPKTLPFGQCLSPNSWVYDFDSVLPFPCPIQTYFDKSFQPTSKKIPMELRPEFRIIDSEDYRKFFNSDRSHMKNEHGEWSALPPQWPVIENHSEQALDLAQLLNFDSSRGGEVKSLQEFSQAILS